MKVAAKKISNALKKIAEKSDLDFNEARVLLALERLAARLDAHRSLHNHLVFKGGFVLLRCYDHLRFTRDPDALYVGKQKSDLSGLISEALDISLDDGFWFGDARVQTLIPDDPYGAFRFNIAFQLGSPPSNSSEVKKLSRLDFDIGFGDTVTPSAKSIKTESIVEGLDPLSWRVYPMETIIAEKLETLIKRGSLNSRGKDIYDLLELIPRASDVKNLKAAITSTFSNRETELPSSFCTVAEELDLLFLKNSWNSVELMSEKITFEKCWKELLKVLKDLDQKIQNP